MLGTGDGRRGTAEEHWTGALDRSTGTETRETETASEIEERCPSRWSRDGGGKVTARGRMLTYSRSR
jgi:hypothetical protein